MHLKIKFNTKKAMLTHLKKCILLKKTKTLKNQQVNINKSRKTKTKYESCPLLRELFMEPYEATSEVSESENIKQIPRLSSEH